MKDQTYIKNYSKKNLNPDQKYCPDLMIYWRGHTKDGNWIKNYDPKTGKVFFSSRTWDRELVHYYLSARSYTATGVYFKPIRDGKILEVAFVSMSDMSRAKDGEVRLWKFSNNYFFNKRVFWVKETNIIYNEDGTEYRPEENGKYYNKKFVRALMEMCHQGYVITRNNRLVLADFTGVNYPYLYKIIQWYKNAKPRNTKENPLLSIELPEITPMHSVYFEMVNDNLGVFRLYPVRYFSGGNENKERFRVFVDNKNKVTILENYREWKVKSASSIYRYSYKEDDLKLDMEKLKTFQPFRYIYDILATSKNDIDVVNNVIFLLRHPIVETFNKAGYPRLSVYLCKNSQIKANIRKLFGVDIKKETGSLTKLLNINKYLLQKLENSCEDHYGSFYINNAPVKLMHDFFGDKLKDLTEKDIDMYYDGFKTINSKYGNIRWYFDPNCTARHHNRFYFDNDIEEFDINDEHMKKLITKLCKLGTGAISAYMDAMTTYKSLMNKPEIDFMDFRKTEDITRLHDNLVTLLNAERELQKQERNKAIQEVFEKKQAKRIEKFEDTESDNNFEIVVPKSLTEITTEGQALSHCVGGYLERHGRGDTNILFLRNKAFPSTPFYTIEVDNSGYVVQIHGKCNRWLGNDPEAIAFVNKWIKKRQLRCEEYKLLNTGSGYGRSANNVDRKYLIA